MNHTGIEHLSSQQKRALLVKLLNKKGNDSGSRSLDGWERVGHIDDQLATSVTDLADEAILDPAINPGVARPVDSKTGPARVFLTGATGFLGAFLLHELLQQTRADIYCLVRCSKAEEGKKRIQNNLEFYVPGTEYKSSRIIPVVGDMSEPLMGLSDRQFQGLASEIDSIYHNGAWVSWVHPYDRLKPTNVLGTQEVLRLASQIQVKPVHFVSSLAVFPVVGDSEAQMIREHDSLDHGGVLYGGYSHSKWVAEKLVTIARSRGLPVSIYRPGVITGHSQVGTSNTGDGVNRLIKSWIRLRYVPNLDIEMDMTPVDYVSSAIVHLSKQEESLGKAFHLANPRPVHVRELVTWIRSFGYPLQLIPYHEWRAELTDLAQRFEDGCLRSLLPVFSLSVSEMVPRLLGTVKVDCQNTLDGLSGTSIVCAPVNAELLEIYLSYFIRSGFLDAPMDV